MEGLCQMQHLPQDLVEKCIMSHTTLVQLNYAIEKLFSSIPV
jgi:hypothetical protein